MAWESPKSLNLSIRPYVQLSTRQPSTVNLSTCQFRRIKDGVQCRTHVVIGVIPRLEVSIIWPSPVHCGKDICVLFKARVRPRV